MNEQIFRFEIKGSSFDAHVAQSNGEFYAFWNGIKVVADSLPRLKVLLAEEMARKPLNVPYIRVEGGSTFKRGVIIGRHQNGNLITREHGETFQTRSYERLLRADVSLRKLRRLLKTSEVAHRTLTKYMDKFTIVGDKIRYEDKPKK